MLDVQSITSEYTVKIDANVIDTVANVDSAADLEANKSALGELTDGKMWEDLNVVGWSVGAAAAFSAAAAGLVAWSVHEYPPSARARALLTLDLALLLLFAVRNGMKAWRGGGCTQGGRIRLVLSGDDCTALRRCGCGWPAML